MEHDKGMETTWREHGKGLLHTEQPLLCRMDGGDTAHTQAWQRARTTLHAAEAVGAIKSVLRSVGVQSCLVTEGDTYVCGFFLNINGLRE